MSRPSGADPCLAARADRAHALLAERPHAAQLLSFYVSLLELQAPLHDRTNVARWLPLIGAPDALDLPWLQLERLPLDELSPRFGGFC